MQLYILLGPVWALVIVAQNSSNVPNCTDNKYHWTFNSLGQSPCYVAVALTSFVNSGPTYMIPSLLYPSDEYNPLPPSLNSSRFCNTVFYSLLSGCGLCQDGIWPTWPDFSQVCNQTYLMEYPGPIPSNTSVPDWAYINVTATNDNFDAVAASSIAGAGSSTSAPTSTSSTSTLSSTSTSTSTSHSTLDVGAIAGGTIGGLVGLIVLILLLLLYMRRRRSGLIVITSPQPTPPIELIQTVPSNGYEPQNTDEISTSSPTSEGHLFDLEHSIQTTSSTTWFSEQEQSTL